MFKVFVVLICIFCVSACDPVEQKQLEQNSEIPFLCLLSQSSCEIDSELGKLAVSFSGNTEQGKLKTELPFHIQVQVSTLDDMELVSIDSYLEGKSMFMGKIPVFFNDTSKVNMKRAESLLASCSDEVMTWRLWLDIKVKSGEEVKTQKVFIDFDSIRL